MNPWVETLIVGDEGRMPLIESIMDTLSRKLESTDSSGSNDSTAAPVRFRSRTIFAIDETCGIKSCSTMAAFFLLRLMVPFKSSDLPEGIVGIVILPLVHATEGRSKYRRGVLSRSVQKCEQCNLGLITSVIGVVRIAWPNSKQILMADWRRAL